MGYGYYFPYFWGTIVLLKVLFIFITPALQIFRYTPLVPFGYDDLTRRTITDKITISNYIIEETTCVTLFFNCDQKSL